MNPFQAERGGTCWYLGVESETIFFIFVLRPFEVYIVGTSLIRVVLHKFCYKTK